MANDYSTAVETTTATLLALMKVYYDKTLLYFAKPVMVADQFADHSRDIPQKEGKSVNFTRWVPLTKIMDSTTEGANPAEVEMEAFDFEKTVAKYANTIRLTELVKLTAYDDVLNGAVELQGVNMGESVNYQYRKAMATGFYPLRVDNSTTYAKTGTVGATASNTTSTMYSNLTGDGDHFWGDGVLIFTSGQNAGSVHVVTESVDSNGEIDFTPALKEKAEVGDTFRIVNSTALTSANVVTCASVERAVAILKKNKAPKYDGKNYIGIIAPFVSYDFMQDSAWVNADLYAGSTKLYDGELGRWGGVRWVEDTEGWTETITDGSVQESTQDRGFGFYNATGAINHTPIFGKHAYAGTRIAGVKDKLIIKVSGPQDTSNATNAYSKVSWRVFFIAVPLNGLFGVNLISGASTIA